MNKKGKNKKGKPISIPSQEEKSVSEEFNKSDKKIEDVTTPGDKKETNVAEKIEHIKEERVPEIISETIASSVEIKDEEGPKKPKRNRGKKKKGKEDDFDEIKDVKPKETEIQSAPEDTKVDILEAELKSEELPDITPTARKKKNKKHADHKIDEPLLPPKQDIQSIPVETILKEQDKTEIHQELVKTDVLEPESKQSKKKKKKRNDSEKSDKEAVSCTSAFQQITDENKSNVIKIEEKSEDMMPLETTKPPISAEIALEQDDDNMIMQPLFENEPSPPKAEEEIKETSVTDGKGKKKNKKDKKQIFKSEDVVKQDEPKTEPIPEIIALPFTPEPIKDITASLQDEAIKDVTELPQPVEESLRPKAKIAKPVEKKRKGKHEIQQESIAQDVHISEITNIKEEPFEVKIEMDTKTTKSEEPSEAKVESLDIPVTKPKTTSILESEICSDISVITADNPNEEERFLAQQFELMAEKAMGKKRKKGPKMPKQIDIDPEHITEPICKETGVKEDIKTEHLPVITDILTPQTEQLEFTIISEKSDIPVTVDTLIESKRASKSSDSKLSEPTEFYGKELLVPKSLDEEKEIAKIDETLAKNIEDTQKDNKSGKKRKKSPKPPKKAEDKGEARALTPKPAGIAIETSTIEDNTKQSVSEKIEPSNITRMYDIAISSIKADESEGSACDVIPDVTYPRAASQQHDDNNNTVIREMFQPEEISQEPTVIQETKAPKIETVFKQPKNWETPPKEEKTDIKSKMMEVNQDMEELRLSIERSLAELTSLENTETAIEKEFAATRSQAEKVSSLLFDTDESAVKKKSGKKEKVQEKKSKESFTSDKSIEAKVTPVAEDIKQNVEDKPQVFTEDKKMPVDKAMTSKQDIQIESPKLVETFEDILFSIDSKPTELVIDKKSINVPIGDKIPSDSNPSIEEHKIIESLINPIPLPFVELKNIDMTKVEKIDTEKKPEAAELLKDVPPVCPTRKDNKGKNKKKKGKQESQATTPAQQTSTTTQSQSTQDTKKEEKSESKTEKSESKDKGENKEKGKQQSSIVDSSAQEEKTEHDFEPIEDFEDALTSSIDDVNKTFEMIVKESQEQSNPKINIIVPDEEKTKVSPPKNLLGHPVIPVRSNRRDYKKEKNKIPNEITAKVKIKDSVEVERKESKNTQTATKLKELRKDDKMNDDDEFVYKYSFRKVFLQSACHICKKNLGGSRVPCSYCNLLFYCSSKHKDEDWPHHQALCFAVSTIGHLKDQKHIYADAKNVTGHDYRLIRMQMIVSCEKVLKRRLVPWEQEALLYPRVCAYVPCREWRQSKLSDCQGCWQISFCTDNPEHFPKTHSRWCKSYSLYEKLVSFQQVKGRLEPKMPTKVLEEQQPIPEKINEVLASMYEEKIDINDIQYAALTQIATAPLTAAYCHQLCRNKIISPTNGVTKKSSFTIHVVGAELQFEADALNKWEVFFLHLRPDLQELRVVLINYNLNPSNLPLELLGKIKLCEDCRQRKRRVVFNFQDKKTYSEYKASDEFTVPDIVCAFNPSIQRSSVYNGKDPWPSTINVILKLKVPFIITAYTITELHKDCIRIKEISESGYNFIADPKFNNFASVRPDRNFISDDEIPLLFKNYCFAIISG